jgi:hypothetical protein
MSYVIEDSTFQWLLVVVSYLMAEPNMRAIMQNLTATSLWELGRLTCRVLRFRRLIDRPAQNARAHVHDGPDSLTTVMLTAIDALSDRAGEVTIKAQRSRYDKTEITIKVSGTTRQVTSLSLPVTNTGVRSFSKSGCRSDHNEQQGVKPERIEGGPV